MEHGSRDLGEQDAPIGPRRRTASGLVRAVGDSIADKVSSVTGSHATARSNGKSAVGLLLVVAVSAGGGAWLNDSGGGRVNDHARRLEAYEDRLSAVEQTLAASDAGERLAAYEARLSTLETDSARQDLLLAGIIRNLEVQLQVSRSISGNLERIGRKLRVDLEPLSDELQSEVNRMQLESTLRSVREGAKPSTPM